ncbi:MAG: L,D-transpeptidase family protein [Verrucomicrobia bacterium]|nr:L,D-transpeptidase family protein [Verrucomicrobiota bacterium]
MKPSVKTALIIILLVAVALVSYSLGRRQDATPAPAPATPSQPAAATPAGAPPSATVATTAPAPSAADRELFEKATALRADGKLADARDALRALLAKLPPANATGEAQKTLIADAQKNLGELNIKLLFTLASAPEKVEYVIQPGDSLGKIARQYSTTIEVIQKANNLGASPIQPAQRLRVMPTKFATIVSKSANTLLLTDDGKFFKLYRVGTGQHSMTPIGSFKITERIQHPAWWKEGQTIPYGSKENILGTHWLALDIPHYGIHGTWQPETIGQQSSAGCIRLTNEDVEELFTILPTGTPVEIKD